MAGPYELKAGDLERPLAATLLQGNNQPIDLATAAGVAFSMRQRGGTKAILKAPVTIIQAGSQDLPNMGKVQYSWQPGDTDVVGVYDAEFEIDWGAGRTQTVPNDDYLTVVIKGDI